MEEENLLAKVRVRKSKEIKCAILGVQFQCNLVELQVAACVKQRYK